MWDWCIQEYPDNSKCALSLRTLWYLYKITYCRYYFLLFASYYFYIEVSYLPPGWLMETRVIQLIGSYLRCVGCWLLHYNSWDIIDSQRLLHLHTSLLNMLDNSSKKNIDDSAEMTPDYYQLKLVKCNKTLEYYNIFFLLLWFVTYTFFRDFLLLDDSHLRPVVSVLLQMIKDRFTTLNQK